MLKKGIVFSFLLLIIITTPVFANSGVDYLINQPVQEENAFDLKTLAMLVSSYKLSGNDTSELEDRLISMSDSEDFIVKDRKSVV